MSFLHCRIRSYLAILFAVANLVLWMAMGYWIYSDMGHERASVESLMLSMARLSAQDAGRVVRETGEMLAALTAEPEAATAIESGRCVQDFAKPVALIRRYTGLVLTDAEGLIVCSSAPSASPDVGFAGLLAGLKRGKEWAVGRPHRDATGRWAVPMAYLVKREGVVIGGAVLFIGLDHLSVLVPPLDLPGERTATLLTREGVVVASSEDHHLMVGARPDAEAWPKALLLGSGVMSATAWKDAERHYAVAPVPGTEWVAAVGMDVADFSRPLSAVLGARASVLAVAAVLSLLLLAAAGRHIGSPLRRIARAVKLAEGGAKRVRVPERGLKEIAEMATAFNRLLDTLAAKEAALLESETAYRNLFESNRLVNLLVDPQSGYIAAANKAAAKYYGLSVSSLENARFSGLSADTPGTAEAGLEHAAEGRLDTAEARHRAAGGEVRDVEVHFGPVEFRGRKLVSAIVHDITERKRMEIALIESERNFSLLFESSPDAMLFATFEADPVILKVNAALLAIFGLGRKQVLGSRLSTLDPFLDPHSREDILSRLHNGQTLHDIEIDIRDNNGKETPIALSAKILTRGSAQFLFISARDITERQRVMEELLATQVRWQFAIEGHGDGLWDWDMKNKSVFLSRRCREIAGFEQIAEELIYERWTGAIAEEDRPEVLASLQLAWQDPSRIYCAEYRFVCPDGRLKWLSSRGMVVVRDLDETPLRMIGTVREITESKREEERERKRQEDVFHAGRIAMMGEMVTTLGHELNQPLTAIGALAATCERRFAANPANLANIREMLNRINGQAQRAGEIVWRIREFVRKRTTQRATLDLNPLVRNVVRFLTIEARMREVVIDLDLAEDLPPVFGDRIQIEQVLMNLVQNSLEATRGSAGEQRVTISTRATPDGVEVAVRDRGPGVPATLRDEVFEPFFTTKPEGTGMGLAISRTIVEAHGGSLHLNPEVAVGAEFLFSLPKKEGVKACMPG